MHVPILTLAALALAAFAAAAPGQNADLKTAAPPLAEEPAPDLALLEPASGGTTAPPDAFAAFQAESFDPLRKGIAYGADGPTAVSAASRRWKARFAPEGTSFVPWFGSEKPRPLPLTLRLESITAGSLPLHAASGAVSRSGERVAIGRGSVEEVWHLSEEGVEQTFVIAERTAPGEIVVRVAFEGEYEAELDEQGILFTGELGAVRYGRAFAFDAAGRRTDVAQALDGRSIVLGVPATFVAEALFPITIDPVIATFDVEPWALPTILPDVAYLDASGRYLYTYVRVFSQTDHDVYTVLGDDSGILPGTLAVVDSSIEHWTRPRAASNAAAQSFLVVAEVGLSPARKVRARLVHGSTGTPGGVIDITAGTFDEQLRPDVGGDPNPGPGTRYCVVWERAFSAQDHDILARMVDPSTGALSPILWVENSSQTLDQKPAIAKSCGLATDGTPHWTIVWQRRHSPVDHDVHGAQIAWGGTIHTPTFAVIADGHDDVDPAVSSIADGAGPHRPYVVATSRRMPAGDRDVFLHGMVGGQPMGTFGLSWTQALSHLDDLTPVVETDGHLTCVAYTKVFGPTDSDIWVSWVSFAGGLFAQVGPIESGAGTHLVEAHPALVAKHSGGASSRRFALAFDVAEGSGSDVRAAILEGPSHVPFSVVCTGSGLCPCGPSSTDGGCPNSANALGARLTAVGSPYVSDDRLVLMASSMPASSVCVFLQGTTLLNAGNGLPFGDGLRCVGGSVIRIATRPASAGSASYPGLGEPTVSERGQIPPIGGIRFYQVWYRDPASFCTSATFNFTNALTVTWLP